MADKTIDFRKLEKIVRQWGIVWDATKGKGSHGSFVQKNESGESSYAIPHHGKEVQRCYVRGIRKKFKLTAEDGVSDQQFYVTGPPKKLINNPAENTTQAEDRRESFEISEIPPDQLPS